jgi:hypothetical protein
VARIEPIPIAHTRAARQLGVSEDEIRMPARYGRAAARFHARLVHDAPRGNDQPCSRRSDSKAARALCPGNAKTALWAASSLRIGDSRRHL